MRGQQIKGCHSKDDQRAQNVVIPMRLGSNTISARQTSLVTGIHRRNVKSGLVKRIALEAKMDLELSALCDRRKRVDALGPHVTKLVEEYWICNTRISPNKKRRCKEANWCQAVGQSSNPPPSRITG